VLPLVLLHAYLFLLVAERLVEQAVSRRNARRLLAAGGVEAGRGHYPAMVAFHTLFLAAAFAEPLLWGPAWIRAWPPAAAVGCLALALLAQALRWWAVASLRGRWTTRVIALPGAAPETGGPYRWLRHPNYLAVVVELLCVPLIGGAVVTALAGSLGNALLLRVRIPAEEQALGAAWARAFEGKARLVPSAPRRGAAEGRA
jgi:methyltransferase